VIISLIWFPRKQTLKIEITMQDIYLGEPWNHHLWNGEEGSRFGQKEKLSFNAIPYRLHCTPSELWS